jgi:heat shock protein HtpX
MGNTFKTALLLTALTLFLLFMGSVFGGQRGLVLAFGLAVVMNFVSYFFSDKIALAAYRAQPVTREQLPRAYQVVERLTQKMGIPMPKMYVIPTDSPNAFATGRNPKHASVAMTEGILNLLNDDELEGVLAHELGHVRNRDILISSVAATLAGAITMGVALRGRWQPRGSRRRRRFRRPADADSGSHRGHADTVGGIALARVPSRRDRRGSHR